MPGPDRNALQPQPKSRAWVTLITRGSYLPGAVLLVHSLAKHKTKFPIIVQYTDSLEEDCVKCLHGLLDVYDLLHVQHVERLYLPEGAKSIAKRFDDAPTKLRVFAPLDCHKKPTKPAFAQIPEEVCFLDADILVFRNLDDIFDIPRPGPDWIAGHHICVCNVDNDPWAPPEWKPENCVTSLFSHPDALVPFPSPSANEGANAASPQQLNGGVFVCTPSNDLYDFWHHDERVKDFNWADQSFLNTFFSGHWVPIGWQYNALKTHRYWHSMVWRDDEVRALHYIVDKPWEARVNEDGTAGYMGRDGVTHGWWWKEYEEWEQEMEAKEQKDVLACMRNYVLVDSKLGETRFNR